MMKVLQIAHTLFRLLSISVWNFSGPKSLTEQQLSENAPIKESRRKNAKNRSKSLWLKKEGVRRTPSFRISITMWSSSKDPKSKAPKLERQRAT